MDSSRRVISPRVTGRAARWRLAAGLAAASLVTPFLASGTGQQDIAALIAHSPEVVAKARLDVLPGTFRTLKAATFAWPAASALPPGSAIPVPARLPALAIDIDRSGKGDRLEPGDRPDADGGRDNAGPGLPAAFADAGTASASAPAGIGSGTGLASAGMGTGGSDLGSGTDPYEADDDIADANDLAAYSSDAGDPTGDPAELESAASAGDDAVVIGLDQVGESGGPASPAYADPFAEPAQGLMGPPEGALPIYRQASLIFGLSGMPTQRFLGGEGPGSDALDGQDAGSSVASKDEDGDDLDGADAPTLGRMEGASPAERLGLDGRRRARAEKCLADAVYFESRGEPERGQVAVAQVVMNRVFSGYYPADVCRAVYQNANRKFACQFTFACDNIRDVVTEPRLWKQAERIAADMLDGRLWDSKVGRATHYHAQSVRPFWISEMRKLDRIGEHTFYRPRRWTS